MSKVSLSTIITVSIVLVFVEIGLGAYGVLVTKFAKKNQADPLVFSLARDGFSFPVLFLAAYVAEREFILPNKRELPALVAIGFFGTLGQAMNLLGIYYVSTDIASMFQPMAIIWVCILSVVMHIEPIPNLKKLHGFAKVSGILLAISGAVIISYEQYTNNKSKDMSKSSLEIVGYLVLVVNTFAAGIYMVVQKKYIFKNNTSRFRDNPVTTTAWSYFFSTFFMLLASIYYYDKPERFSSVTNDTVYPLIYSVFITSSLSYMLMSWANMKIDATLVTAFWPLQTFFCVLLAYFVLDEVLNSIQIFGGILMIIATLMVVWSNYKENSLKEDYEPLTSSSEEEDGVKNRSISINTV